MNRVKKFVKFVRTHWPLELSVSLFLAVSLLLLFVQLRTLVGGYSQEERLVEVATNSFPNLLDNILYWPYYLLVYALRFVVTDGILAARIISASLAFLATFNILLIINRWFSTELAIVGATVFVSCSWLLQIGRVGTPQIMGIAVLLSIFTGMLWLIYRPKKILPSIFTGVALVFGMFVPFIPLLILAGLLLAVFKERNLLKVVPIWLWALIGIGIISIILLYVFGGLKNYGQTSKILGIPDDLPNLHTLLVNLRSSLAAIFWYAPANPAQWVGNLPLLDIFGVVMVTLGVYHHERTSSDRRSLILFGSTLIILLMTALSGGINSPGFSLLLPLVALFIISGLYEFLNLWRKVFPVNPIAKILSVMVVAILVSVSSYYQLSRYFIAWSNSPQTRDIYSVNIK
ncbi:hypothetical protein H6798_03085 [Candidatus Nomurabacteria bacterium]|nr:hypothetical protein [Candidatus Nomurabacteria bacterium]